MNDFMNAFVIFALAVFCSCMIYFVWSVVSNLIGSIYYNAIRSNIAEAIDEVLINWDGDSIPFETVTEILVLLHNRKTIYYSDLRRRQGGLYE